METTSCPSTEYFGGSRSGTAVRFGKLSGPAGALSHTVIVIIIIIIIIITTLTTHCSLLRLIVRSWLDVPTFTTRRLHACHHARAPSGGKWNCGREMSFNFV